ncbi:class I SAM-dependent methyltransferase [Nocardioides sp.]|uniref:class I SAM-dependent methyltransferase n=1 Tax=Nocardioides sp. TaxID=35761 RepID=UPI002BE3620B|nr:class I SAM-dependent methyltransferase [Nocardioides sp.]HXH80677.1 class I SAM-dependent methyltransferase [Nocardioides sp.]
MDNHTSDPVLAHFDGVADAYDEVLPFFVSFAREAVARTHVDPGARALDVAAGRGAFTAALLEHGADVVAVDGAPRMVALLERDFPSINAAVMDASRLDFPDEAFDLVACGFALHIVADPWAAMSEISRVLKPGGEVALTVPGRADGSPDPWEDPLVDLYAEFRKYQSDGVGRHGNDADEAELLADSPLTDVVATTLEVAIPVADGDTYWRWSRSHGSGRFIDGLSPERRAEMHSLLMARMNDLPGFTLRRSATLWTARKPS